MNGTFSLEQRLVFSYFKQNIIVENHIITNQNFSFLKLLSKNFKDNGKESSVCNGVFFLVQKLTTNINICINQAGKMPKRNLHTYIHTYYYMYSFESCNLQKQKQKKRNKKEKQKWIWKTKASFFIVSCLHNDRSDTESSMNGKGNLV